jgi:hypothetical protein
LRKSKVKATTMRRRARPAPISQREKVKAFLDERMDQGDEGAYEALQLLRGQVKNINKTVAWINANSFFLFEFGRFSAASNIILLKLHSKPHKKGVLN